MPPLVLADFLATVTTLTAIATLVVGCLATLFSVIYLSTRAVQRRTVRARLRAGITASILLIALAALDIYLAAQQLITG
jgi:hypothetical protein